MTHAEPITFLTAEQQEQLQPPCDTRCLPSGVMCPKLSEWIVEMFCPVCSQTLKRIVCSVHKEDIAHGQHAHRLCMDGTHWLPVRMRSAVRL